MSVAVDEHNHDVSSVLENTWLGWLTAASSSKYSRRLTLRF